MENKFFVGDVVTYGFHKRMVIYDEDSKFYYLQNREEEIRIEKSLLTRYGKKWEKQ